MKLQQIHYFLALAEELHFWRTAEKVFITQSALSRQIIALENELGVRLFDRDKRNVRLTPAGVFLREKLEKLIADLENACRYAQLISSGEVGELKIGYPGSITHSVLPDLLQAFAERFPLLRVELNEVVAENLEAALLDYRLDIGFKRDRPENRSLDAKEVLIEPFCLVVPENHAFSGDKVSDLTLFSKDRFILPSMTKGHAYSESLREIFSEYGFLPDVRFESEYGSIILPLIEKGLGVSFLPASYRSYGQSGVRFIETPHLTRLYMLWRNDDTNIIISNILKILFTG